MDEGSVEAGPTGRIRILHVDDEPEFSTLVKTFLEREHDDLEVVTEKHARAAVARIESEDIDCIVSDYDMPDQNGIEFLETVRTTHPSLPFILFTGKGSEEIASEAISAGVTDYLQKTHGTDQYTLLANRIRNAVERYQYSQDATETRTQLHAIAEHSADAILIIDTESRIQFANPAVETHFGYTPAELQGEPLTTIMPARYHQAHHAALNRYLDTGERTLDWTNIEFPVLHRDGTEHPFSISYSEFEQRGERRFIGILRDISERTQYEDALTVLHDTADRILSANTREDVAQHIVDTVYETLEMPINGVFLRDDGDQELIPVAVSTRGEALIAEIPSFEPGSSLAWQVFEHGETQYYRDVSAVAGRLNPDTPIRSEIIVPMGSYGIVMIGSPEVGVFSERDVSLVETIATHGETALERINREAELAEREARYRSLTDDVLDTSSIGTFILNADFEIEWISEATEDYFGIDRSEVLGADKRQLIHDHIKEIFEEPDEFAETVLATYEDNSYVEEFECHVLPDAGRTERWLQHWSQPIETGIYAGGRIEHYTDISELKRREQELEAQNARLEEFASVVSHDLRNPLNVAQGRLALLREDYDAPEFDTISRALDRIQTLIDDLLLLARQGTTVDTIEPVELQELVASCWASVATQDATLVCEASGVIAADRSRLQQLVENLIRNSIEHGGDSVTVTVGELTDGFYIEDTGPGIPPEHRDQIFEMGYTTTAEGTGFGLSIVNQIATAHNWTVHVEEAASGGARFEFRNVEWH